MTSRGYSFLLTAILFSALAACTHPPSRSSENSEDTAAPALPQDPLYGKITSGSDLLQITAGRSAGKLRLKDSSESLHSLLGKADSVAVGMCKDLSIWHSSASASVSVYSLCDNDLDMRKSIQIIRLSEYPFSTETGISGQSTYGAIRESYPGITPLGKFTANGRTFYLADDVQNGIAFELSDTLASGQCRAVLVHLPGSRVSDTNIPLYPGLEKFR